MSKKSVSPSGKRTFAFVFLSNIIKAVTALGRPVFTPS